jgi:Tat protein secretion system quality control protein TatD with DNase activity
MRAVLPPLVDTHCHLVLLDERGLLDAALEGATAAGVDQIITVGDDGFVVETDSPFLKIGRASCRDRV